ncbi:hypothetical protein Syun_026145 [Stephania yunnanensis]|uniref:Uncharacterized protein n=1 Tax=Stephania yunnanensis TaxID=152371 RepID=A0AAP0ET04_9MAGN
MGHKEIKKNGVNWMSWSRLYERKEDGGMGFKNLHCLNSVPLAKQRWRISPTYKL